MHWAEALLEQARTTVRFNGRIWKRIKELTSKNEPVEYVVEPLATGFFCRNTACGAFNGDAKEFRLTCRACETPRPKMDLLPPFTTRQPICP